MIKFGFEEMFGFSYHLSEALQRYGPSEEPTETGFNISTGIDSTLYAYIDEERKQGRPSAFTSMLEETASYEFSAADAIVRGLDWEGMGGVVVDVCRFSSSFLFFLSVSFHPLGKLTSNLLTVT